MLNLPVTSISNLLNVGHNVKEDKPILSSPDPEFELMTIVSLKPKCLIMAKVPLFLTPLLLRRGFRSKDCGPRL